MNNYNPFICDFDMVAKKAKRMTMEALLFSIEDCRECIRLGINPSKYCDEISVYQMELNFRKQRQKRRR